MFYILFLFLSMLARADGFDTSFNSKLASAVNLSANDLDILSNDLSIMFLGQIFGNVAGLLHGSSTLFGHLFGIFNLACMALASSSLGYSTLNMVLSSASEGVAMGKKMQNTHFYLIARQFMSVAAMTPHVSGYSSIQVLLIWVVTKGIFLADVLWIKTADLLVGTQNIAVNLVDIANSNPDLARSWHWQNNNNVMNPSVAQVTSSINFLSEIYSLGLCSAMASIYENGFLKITAINLYSIDKQINGNNIKYVFPSNCGSASISPVFLDKFDAKILAAIDNAISSTLSIVNQDINFLFSEKCFGNMESCPSVCNRATNNCPSGGLLYNAADGLAEAINLLTFQSGADDFEVKRPFNLKEVYGLGWVNLAGSYYRGFNIKQNESTMPHSSYLIDNFASTSKGNGKVPKIINDLSKEVLAYMFNLQATFNSNLDVVNKDICTDSFKKINYFASWYCDTEDLKKKISQTVSIAWNQVSSSVDPGNNLNTGNIYDARDSVVNMNKKLDEDLLSKSKLHYDVLEWDKTPKAFWPLMASYHIGIINAWNNVFLNPVYLKTMITDPLFSFSQLAQMFTAASLKYLILGTAVVANDLYVFFQGFISITSYLSISGIMADGAAAYLLETSREEWNACFFSPIQLGPFCFIIWILFIPLMLSFFIGIVMDLITTIFRICIRIIFDIPLSFMAQLMDIGLSYKMRFISLVFGLSIPVMVSCSYVAVFIPMLPILMYVIAIVGWLMSVIEAMIGVPLMVLGMTNMQGHDLLGSAQSAGMLILSVFIRPAALVLGFIFGVLLLSAFALFISLFIVPYIHGFLTIVDSSFVDVLTKAVIITIMMLMFMGVYANVIQFAFSSMFKIPNNLFRWIGMPGMHNSEEELIDQIQSEAKSQLGSMAGMFGSIQNGLSGFGHNTKSGAINKAALSMEERDDDDDE